MALSLGYKTTDAALELLLVLCILGPIIPPTFVNKKTVETGVMDIRSWHRQLSYKIRYWPSLSKESNNINSYNGLLCLYFEPSIR